jgi:hypothetical protein
MTHRWTSWWTALFTLFGSALLLSLGGCGDSPTDVHSSPTSLSLFCLPAGNQVSCTASYFSGSGGQRDVTAQAQWQVTDPSIGVFVRPGVFSPARRGEAVISASFAGVQAIVPFRFLVDPVRPPQYLQFLSGLITDDATGALLVGATVEILSGYAQGARATTNANGHYQIDTVLAGETFTLRATSPGYATVTTSYRVDPSVTVSGGPNNPPFLDFRLHKLE